jgi:hypothetical protein
MVYKLSENAAKGWRKLNAPQRLQELKSGLNFRNGESVEPGNENELLAA